MKHIVRYEWINASEEIAAKRNKLLKGCNFREPWVAKICGLNSQYGFSREFVRGEIDYSESNGCGSRGVLLRFIVEEEYLYEVYRCTSWRSSDRFFCFWRDGELHKMSKNEVLEWL